MAQKIQTLYIDDLDGSEAAGTVRFGLDGSDYEIDLNADNEIGLRKALLPYVDAGRRVTSRNAPKVRVRDRTRPDTAEVRTWARQRGYEINERGRIPVSIVAEFKARNSGSVNGATPTPQQLAEEQLANRDAGKPPEAEAATVKSGPAKSTAARGGGKKAKAQPAEPPLAGYDDMALASLRGKVRHMDLDLIKQLAAWESEHQNRANILAMFAKRQASLEAAPASSV